MTEICSPYLEGFLKDLAAQNVAKATLTAYAHDIGLYLGHIAQVQGTVSLPVLVAIPPRFVRNWLSERREGGLDAASSRARALSALKTFYRYLHRIHGIENAALLAMSGPKKPARLPRPTGEEDTKMLLSTSELSSEDPWVAARDLAVLTLLYAAGLRISEALSLKGDMSPAPETLRIVGKGKKIRLVPLIQTARDALDTYAGLCPFELSDETRFFYGVRGGALSPRIVQRLMQFLRGQLGLPDTATPHALRHAFASHLLANGGDLRSIQSLMGHASPSTTQVYLGLEDARLTNAHKLAHPRA